MLHNFLVSRRYATKTVTAKHGDYEVFSVTILILIQFQLTTAFAVNHGLKIFELEYCQEYTYRYSMHESLHCEEISTSMTFQTAWKSFEVIR